MSSDSRYAITVPDRTTLLQGPHGGALLLAGDRTGGRLSTRTVMRTSTRWSWRV